MGYLVGSVVYWRPDGVVHRKVPPRSATLSGTTLPAPLLTPRRRSAPWPGLDPAAAADAAWATSDTLHVAAAVLGSRILRQPPTPTTARHVRPTLLFRHRPWLGIGCARPPGCYPRSLT
jgi:hypothetical protein